MIYVPDQLGLDMCPLPGQLWLGDLRRLITLGAASRPPTGLRSGGCWQNL
jgi:hypothetical protein